MRARILLVAPVLLLATALACGPLSFGKQAAPTTQPTATQPAKAQPTTAPAATAVPPAPTQATAATKPPATPTKPAATPTSAATTNLFSDLWSNAQGKAKSATKYRMAMSFIIGAMDSGVFKEQPFIVMEGYVVGPDSYQTYTGGMMNEVLGGTKIEMIDVGGKSYMKGGTMFGMMDPTKWYIMSDSSQSSPPLEPGDMLNLAGSDLQGLQDPPKKTGTEILDGKSCDVYTWNIKSSASLLGFLTNPEQKSDLSAVDKAEARSWLCADGFAHKMVMEIAGHNATDATQKGSLKIETHMWDFDNPTLVIKAPDGAIPFGE